MSSSTLQFLVAGALIAAWAWMLGRPILTNLFRRSRRDSVGHFRYQQAVLGRPLNEDPFSRRSVLQTVLQPLRDWRNQPVERRRLQIMLGFSFATFFSLLLAIALRGAAIRLFLIMIVSFAAYLAYAAYVGAAQLRRQQTSSRLNRRASTALDDRRFDDQQAETASETAATTTIGMRHTVSAQAADKDELEHHSDIVPDDSEIEDLAVYAEDASDPFDGRDGFGTGNFDDGFFEPIPELQFAPLNLDASLIQPEQVGELEDDDVLISAEHDLEVFADDEDSDLPARTEILEQDEHPHPEPVVAETIGPILEPEHVVEDADENAAPSFTSPPRQRPRPTRKKARPIYIESQLDEVDGQQRVVND